jgi:hypothetical protein
MNADAPAERVDFNYWFGGVLFFERVTKFLFIKELRVTKKYFQKSGENPPGGITNAPRCDRTVRMKVKLSVANSRSAVEKVRREAPSAVAALWRDKSVHPPSSDYGATRAPSTREVSNHQGPKPLECGSVFAMLPLRPTSARRVDATKCGVDQWRLEENSRYFKVFQGISRYFKVFQGYFYFL